MQPFVLSEAARACASPRLAALPRRIALHCRTRSTYFARHTASQISRHIRRFHFRPARAYKKTISPLSARHFSRMHEPQRISPLDATDAAGHGRRPPAGRQAPQPFQMSFRRDAYARCAKAGAAGAPHARLAVTACKISVGFDKAITVASPHGTHDTHRHYAGDPWAGRPGGRHADKSGHAESATAEDGPPPGAGRPERRRSRLISPAEIFSPDGAAICFRHFATRWPCDAVDDGSRKILWRCLSGHDDMMRAEPRAVFGAKGRQADAVSREVSTGQRRPATSARRFFQHHVGFFRSTTTGWLAAPFSPIAEIRPWPR